MAPEREEEESLPPEELAERYLARADWRRQRRAGPAPETWALSIWEDWIDRDPERAWRFFLALVRLRPSDDEVLEQVWYRLRFLLRRHGSAFHSRVVELIEGNPRLRRIAPADELEPGALRPKPLDVPALVEAYITNSVASEDAHELDRMIRDDPEDALPLVLEIISRGPLHEFTSYDTFSPLEELLREHGRAVIDRVEAAAADSVLVRRCLWRMRKGRDDPPRWSDIPADVWKRAERAIAGTTDYNSDDPPGVAHSLLPEQEQLVEAWFVYEETFWAWERVHDLVANDPELGWRIVNLLVEAAPSDRVLGSVAAGPLEDLLCAHGVQFVDRVEERARADERFRECLAGTWLSRGDLPDDVLQRLVDASGGEIPLLDSMPGEGEWLREQRARVEEYLSRQGIRHGGVASEPAWSMEFYITLWSVGSADTPGQVEGWVILGEIPTPTTYVPFRDAPDARSAVRVVSAQWADAADSMDRGQRHPDVELEPAEKWPELVPLLRGQARMLARIVEDDREWMDEP